MFGTTFGSPMSAQPSKAPPKVFKFGGAWWLVTPDETLKILGSTQLHTKPSHQTSA